VGLGRPLLSEFRHSASSRRSQYGAIDQRNGEYRAGCEARATSENFVNRHAQTVAHLTKSAAVLATPPASESVGCSATAFGIHDALKASVAATGPSIADEVAGMVDASLAEPGSLIGSGGDGAESGAAAGERGAQRTAIERAAAARVLGSGAMQAKLQVRSGRCNRTSTI